MKRIFALCIGIVALAGCYNDKADQLYPSNTNSCDTATVSFAADIAPVLQQKCATSGCHDATTIQSGYNFANYSGAKLAADNKRLLGAIRWESGFSQMPKGMPKLDDCSINKITRWVNQGAQQN
jgi:hypothetical protein